MQIVIQDTNDLTELDISVLRVLTGSNVPASSPTPTAAKTAAKASPKPTPKVQAEPEPEAEEADEAPEEAAEEGGLTTADALAAASDLVSNGKAAVVKAALAKVGAKKVSEIADQDVATFLSHLA